MTIPLLDREPREHKDTVSVPSAPPMGLTGRWILRNMVGDLQGLVGEGIKELGGRGNSSWSEVG